MKNLREYCKIGGEIGRFPTNEHSRPASEAGLRRAQEELKEEGIVILWMRYVPQMNQSMRSMCSFVVKSFPAVNGYRKANLVQGVTKITAYVLGARLDGAEQRAIGER